MLPSVSAKTAHEGIRRSAGQEAWALALGRGLAGKCMGKWRGTVQTMAKLGQAHQGGQKCHGRRAGELVGQEQVGGLEECTFGRQPISQSSEKTASAL